MTSTASGWCTLNPVVSTYPVNLDRLRSVAKGVDDAVAQLAIRLERLADQDLAGNEQRKAEEILASAARGIGGAGFVPKAGPTPIARTEAVTIVEPEKKARKRSTAAKRPVSRVTRKK